MKTHRRLALACLALLPAAALPAQETPPREPALQEEPIALQCFLPAENQPRFEFRLGAFTLSDISVRFRLNSSQGQIGSDLDFRDTLGGESSLSVFRADGTWRFARHHRLDAAWYDIDLAGSRQLSGEIQFGDQTYPVSTVVDSRFRTNFYKLAYGYTFFRRPRHEVSALVGAHIMTLQASIRTTNIAQLSRFEATAPLPSFGLVWQAAWTDRLATRVALQYFGVSIDEGKYDGRFSDLLAAAEYRLTRRAGLGLGYNRFDLDLDTKSGSLVLNSRYRYNGVLSYLFVRF